MARTLLATLISHLFLPAALLAPAFAAADDASAATASLAVAGVERSAAGISVRTAEGTLSIEPRSERVIHVRYHRDKDWAGSYNPAVIAKPSAVAWTTSSTADTVTLATAAVQVRINKASGAIAFLDAAGKPVLEEAGARPRVLPPREGGALRQTFALHNEDAVYGLGQHQSGYLDYRSNTVRLQQANRDVGVPMLVSSKGYGILWNNASVTEVDVAIPQSAEQLVFRSEAGHGIDYDFIYGPTIDQVIGGYRALTGAAPMMARWTWGLWQSKERYQTQEELLSVAKRHRELGIPLDAVVQDWQYWGKDGWGSHEFDAARFPDPAGMVKALHAANTHVIISVWPRFDLGLKHLAELDAVGAAFPTVYPNVYPAGQGRWYDAWSPAGRDVYWKQIMRRLGRLGFDGWWLDGAETELGGDWGQLRQVRTAQGPGAEVYNSFPLLHTTAVHDGARRDMPEKRAFILTRSAYAGQQRNAAITWSGDTHGDWDTFARQIPAGLNFSLSGIPYWSADIGGFFGGKPSDPAYAELFTRWYQFGVFNPMFRVHGTGEGKEMWRFPTPTQRVLLDYDKLRYRLLPYIYSLSWDVTRRDGSMMRPLAMDFQGDRNALSIKDQYMFGKALLVNPVTRPATEQRMVYLPAGTAWYDFWTGARLEGGRHVAAKADIATIPVYARAGGIVPLGPVKQYADQASGEPVELRVYPGADGRFELYDDQGDGYGYEQGQHATTMLGWDDKRRVLTIGARQGSFPGMSGKQRFKVVCGAGTAGKGGQLVDYAGQAVSVPLPVCR
ncbi:glycoside hydrolase family 31 protein [Pseudoduganella namucuonensis]|uniref:Alpha-D-xyloside xylohydrolase n=1 Tax=Pseudoduganella namucuonensis TaxID=1035707 RepID=A0A1I7KHY1_9BURK|nr:glycoside hydrolase family 31 protein [Pseudoduganella namucuonensis]SFU97029.1 alpha-D-xyloside xylohydrolase [Pseudoduganella namucuonensis]